MSSGGFIVRPFHEQATRNGQSKGRLRVLCIVVLEKGQRISAFMPVLTEGAAVEKGTFFFLNITKHHKSMYN